MLQVRSVLRLPSQKNVTMDGYSLHFVASSMRVRAALHTLDA